MEMVYSLLIFVNVAAITFCVQSEYMTLHVCVRADFARDLRRERKINPRQIRML